MDEKVLDRRIVLIQDRDGAVERAFWLNGVFSPEDLGNAVRHISDNLPDGRTVEVVRVAGTAQCPKSLAGLVLCVANGDSDARKEEARKVEARESEAAGELLGILR